MKTTRPQPQKIALIRWTMPKFAQVTGMIVTSIVVLGTDTNVLLAVPLGILAGGLATFFVAHSDYRDTSKKN